MWDMGGNELFHSACQIWWVESVIEGQTRKIDCEYYARLRSRINEADFSCVTGAVQFSDCLEF
jgi:hypothetical protein